MKKPKRKKPMFIVGEVVFIRPDVRYDRIVKKFISDGLWMYVLTDRAIGVEEEYYENELRPLTPKEIGPRRMRGQ